MPCSTLIVPHGDRPISPPESFSRGPGRVKAVKDFPARPSPSPDIGRCRFFCVLPLALGDKVSVPSFGLTKECKHARTGKCEDRKSHADSEEGLGIIREVKRLRRKKRGCKAMTYDQIARELNQSGLVTQTGKVFTGFNVRGLLACQQTR